MSASLQVVVDLICPWCFIGKTRLDQKLSSMPELSRPKIEWLPFELDPHMPAAGAERAAYRSRRFGSLEKSNEMDARAKAAGEQVGIEFRYERMIRTPNTFNAHRLSWLSEPISWKERTSARRLFLPISRQHQAWIGSR